MPLAKENTYTTKDIYEPPDWIIEIVSPSSQRMDYQIKLSDFLS